MLKNTYTKGSKYDDNYLKPFNEDYSVLGKVKGIYNGIISFNKVWEPLEKTFYAKPYFNARIEEIDELDKYIEIGQYMVFYRVGDYNSQGFDGFELHEENSNKCSWICLINKLKENEEIIPISASLFFHNFGGSISDGGSPGTFVRDKDSSRWFRGYYIRTTMMTQDNWGTTSAKNNICPFQSDNPMKQGKKWSIEFFRNVDNTGYIFSNKIDFNTNIYAVDAYFDIATLTIKTDISGFYYEIPSCLAVNNSSLLIEGYDPYRKPYYYKASPYDYDINDYIKGFPQVTEKGNSSLSFGNTDFTRINNKTLKLNKSPEKDNSWLWVINQSTETLKVDNISNKIIESKVDTASNLTITLENNIPINFSSITFIVPSRKSRTNLVNPPPGYLSTRCYNFAFDYFLHSADWKSVSFSCNINSTPGLVVLGLDGGDGGYGNRVGRLPGFNYCYSKFYAKSYSISYNIVPIITVSMYYKNWVKFEAITGSPGVYPDDYIWQDIPDPIDPYTQYIYAGGVRKIGYADKWISERCSVGNRDPNYSGYLQHPYLQRDNIMIRNYTEYRMPKTVNNDVVFTTLNPMPF